MSWIPKISKQKSYLRQSLEMTDEEVKILSGLLERLLEDDLKRAKLKYINHLKTYNIE